MGVVIEGLWDHEGYAARRLPDGTLTGTWTYATREFDAYVAACGCGWRGTGEHPPTEQGEEFAVDQWDAEHATPLLQQQAKRRRLELGQVLAWLGGQADRLEDPAVLERVGRALDRARALTELVQRDLERPAPEREADGER
jgi:hypothetical protein